MYDIYVSRYGYEECACDKSPVRLRLGMRMFFGFQSFSKSIQGIHRGNLKRKCHESEFNPFV